jgi:hypothetical protein
MNRTVFVAWQDPETRTWFPIGRLSYDGHQFEFIYTKGVLDARKRAAFQQIHGLPDINAVYTSDSLFAVFSNRLIEPTRPDFREFADWMNLPPGEHDPMVLLARSGAERRLDTLQIFPLPEKDQAGKYNAVFFAHGIRHVPGAPEAVANLHPGERLGLDPEPSNKFDAYALRLLSNDTCVGYCPKYINKDLHRLLKDVPESLRVEVERVNPLDAPVQFRLLCKLTSDWPDNFSPFSDEEYQGLSGQSSLPASA